MALFDLCRLLPPVAMQASFDNLVETQDSIRAALPTGVPRGEADAHARRPDG